VGGRSAGIDKRNVGLSFKQRGGFERRGKIRIANRTRTQRGGGKEKCPNCRRQPETLRRDTKKQESLLSGACPASTGTKKKKKKEEQKKSRNG